ASRTRSSPTSRTSCPARRRSASSSKKTTPSTSSAPGHRGMTGDERGGDKGAVGVEGGRVLPTHGAAVDALHPGNQHHHVGLLAVVERLFDGQRHRVRCF